MSATSPPKTASNKILLRGATAWEQVSFKGESLVGRMFGRLLVQTLHSKNTLGKPRWSCVCVCGATKVVAGAALRQGRTVSCGCFQKDRARETFTAHGLHAHPLNVVWRNMKSRCHNSRNPRYLDYGGRGIAVCAEWRNDFLAFYLWAMANGYTEGLTLDRERNDAGYTPGNCRWATQQTQSRNTRRNRVYIVDGKAKTLAALVEQQGAIPYDTVYSRLRKGWGIQHALATPIDTNTRNRYAK